MVINGSMLATELRRRRIGPRALADSLDRVDRSTWVVGDLRTAPSSHLVLAAFCLTSDTPEPAGPR